jgi:amino acid transporter
MSSLAPVAYLATAAAYAGFQWTVQLVVYRQMPLVAAADFPAFERGHQRRITPLVAVLFGGLVLATAWLAFDQPWWAVAATASLTVTILAVTAFGAVPQHRRLQDGWDAAAHRRLLRWDLVRAIAGTAALIIAVGLVLR